MKRTLALLSAAALLSACADAVPTAGTDIPTAGLRMLRDDVAGV